MGHKVHPKIYRTPGVFPWDSRWFGKPADYPMYLEQEIRLRTLLQERLKEAGIDGISVARGPKELTVTLLVGKPGVVIGRGGQGLEVLRKQMERTILRFKTKVKINVQAVPHPALSAAIVAAGAAADIERRLPFRRVMKQILEKVMSAGALGVKVNMAGRLNGVEIARSEKLAAGKMSLITLRSRVDYALAEARTIYGKIGIKVWIYFGETFSPQDKFELKESSSAVERRRPFGPARGRASSDIEKRPSQAGEAGRRRR